METTAERIIAAASRNVEDARQESTLPSDLISFNQPANSTHIMAPNPNQEAPNSQAPI